MLSVLLCAAIGCGLAMEGASAANAPPSVADTYLGMALLLCPLCMLIGACLDFFTRRSWRGKAAICLSLLPLVIALLVVASWVARGAVNGLSSR